MVDARKISIVYANDGACRSLCYRREELIGQPPDVIFADRDAARLALQHQRLNDGPNPAEMYAAMVSRKDGSVFPVEISRALIRRRGRGYIQGIARDVTARVEAQ